MVYSAEDVQVLGDGLGSEYVADLLGCLADIKGFFLKSESIVVYLLQIEKIFDEVLHENELRVYRLADFQRFLSLRLVAFHVSLDHTLDLPYEKDDSEDRCAQLMTDR